MGAYSVAALKAHLSAVLNAVESGEEIVVTRRGKPVARILPERRVPTAIDWKKIDAFQSRLRKSRASVPALRKAARY